MGTKISVIIPVYRVEKFLSKCIESVINQSYKNVEIILVDDGSPDSCGSICERWATQDSRIIVIHKENGGLSDARNSGMKVATGDYISFVDSDDWVMPDFLSTLYDLIKKENADISECGVSYVKEDGQVLRDRVCSEPTLVIDKNEALKRLILEQGVYQTVWNKLYKREVIADSYFPIGRYNEDEFWTYRIIDHVNKYVVSNQILYCYLQRNNSIMGQGYTLNQLDGLQARYERMNYLQNNSALTSFALEHFQYDCLYHMQCVLKYLSGDEQRYGVNFVLDKLNNTPIVHGRNSCITLKYRIWFASFRKYPKKIARFRNKLGIGL